MTDPDDMSLETSEADARPVPKGYTAEELERDNPYNAWLYENAPLPGTRTDPVVLAQIEAARMSPDPKVTVKFPDSVTLPKGIDLMRDMDKVYFSRPINAMVTHAAVPGEVLGHGHPDWPADLTTYAERKAYQRGVADARRVDAEQRLTPMEAVVDFVSRSTHWAEGGATRHDAILALKLLGVWK